jgi:hypothetical protein
MADIQLNSVTLATESGGTVVLDSATSLTGVTIPAAGVTGTLGSGITFPTGHVIQTGQNRSSQTSVSHTNGTTYTAAGYPVSLTAAQTNGKYLVNFFSGRVDSNDSGSSSRCAITLYKDENGAGYSECAGIASSGLCETYLAHYTNSTHFTYLYTASITAGQTIAFQCYYKKTNSTGSVHLTNGSVQFEFIVQEIAL